jgi:hypothetical protein
VNAIGLALRRCGARSTAPMLVTFAAAIVLARTARPEVASAQEAAALPAIAVWAHLPAFVAAIACSLVVLEFWPTFAARQPGAGWVERLEPGPLRGAGQATLGALLATLGWLALWGLALPFLCAGTPAPLAHRPLAPLDLGQEPPLLDAPQRPRLRFAGGPQVPVAALHLRPLALLPRGEPMPTRLEVLGDGEPLTAAPVAIAFTKQLVKVPIAARTVAMVELVQVGGSLPLLFEPGSVLVVEAAPRNLLANALLALLPWLTAAFVALAAANLAAPVASLPVNRTVVVAALVLQSLGDLGPVNRAMAAFLRGRWLPAELGAMDFAPPLAVAFVCLALALAVRRSSRAGVRLRRC